MAEFADINSPLYANISALLPVNISASDYASITKYLGVCKDFEPRKVDANSRVRLLTGYYYAYDWPVASLNNYIEVEQDGNCTKYDGVQSYSFDLHSILVQSLPPSVEGLAHPYRNITILNVATWQICWCIGAAFWPLVMVSLYLTLYGTRRLNGIALLLSLSLAKSPPTQGLFASIMCSLSFMLGNLLQLPCESWVHVSSFQYHLSLYFFIPVVFLTFCEWKLQQWTHYLDDIVIDRKPDGVSWWSHNPPPNTYVTDPEILLRPMGGNFNPQSQQDRAVESGMRLDS
ncbi:uncharacterized protein PAC_00720 [Phialocephala subalpina]|uniref:Uncharacterized protein n=1 Tax=Phialocephala subalpina TaxID=576137 RepID=A0A1L7WDI5_9HELO|nr:uncharacterized protein PAC_00720 [Phialocephala subalpina]